MCAGGEACQKKLGPTTICVELIINTYPWLEKHFLLGGDFFILWDNEVASQAPIYVPRPPLHRNPLNRIFTSRFISIFFCPGLKTVCQDNWPDKRTSQFPIKGKKTGQKQQSQYENLFRNAHCAAIHPKSESEAIIIMEILSFSWFFFCWGKHAIPPSVFFAREKKGFFPSSSPHAFSSFNLGWAKKKHPSLCLSSPSLLLGPNLGLRIGGGGGDKTRGFR